jgi:hypothetical protein
LCLSISVHVCAFLSCHVDNLMDKGMSLILIQFLPIRNIILFSFHHVGASI